MNTREGINVNVLLLLCAGVCALTDLRDGRIYNVIIVPAAIAALLLRGLPICGGNGEHLCDALLRMLILLVLLVPFWGLFPGGIGGGDVKLYVTLAAMLEWDVIGGFIMISFLIALGAGVFMRICRCAHCGLRIAPAVFCATVLYVGGIYG